MSTTTNLSALLLLLVITAPVPSSRTYPQRQKVDENWICPDIYLECPETDSGRAIRFRARITIGVPATEVGFKWKVSGGKITHGQGTEEIIVKGKNRKGQRVTATVEVLGVPKTCNNKATCWSALTHR